MLLLEIGDVLAILGLWIAVPLITLRLVHACRAATPRWARQVSVTAQWTLDAVIILAVLILALRPFAILADGVAGRA
jgi:hypothetical protein